MTTPDEPIHIQPAQAPLSDRGSHRGHLSRPRPWRNASTRVIGFGVTMVVLGGLVAFVFVYLPQRVEAPVPPAGVGERTVDNGRARETPGDAVAPFEAADLARTRKLAEAKLAEFFALEGQLIEQLNVNAWGAEELDRIKDRASAGDQMFMEGHYQESVDEYAGAVRDLAALTDKGRELFRSAIEDGRAALAALDHQRAVSIRAGPRRQTQ